MAVEIWIISHSPVKTGVWIMSYFLKLDIKKSKTSKSQAQWGFYLNFSALISTLSTSEVYAHVSFLDRMCKARFHPIFMVIRGGRSMHRGHFSGPMPSSFAISPLFNWSIALRRVIDDGVRL